MSKQQLVSDLFALIPYLAGGGILTAWGLFFLWIGYLRGWNRGVKDAPGEYRRETDKALVDKTVAEERAETWKNVARRFEISMLQLVEVQQQREVARAPLRAVKP
jgi:hypothetical protein